MSSASFRELLRQTLAPLLPAGLSVTSLVPEPLQEAVDDETLLDDPDRLTARPTPATQDDYDALIKLQVAHKESHAARVLDLVDRHADGDLTAKSALAAFRKETRDALLQSFKLGVSATADGDASRDPSFQKWLETRTAFEASRFSEFLFRAREDTEIMPRERRAELYGRTLDHAFNRGGFAAYGAEVRIIWHLSVAEHCFSCISLAAEGPYLAPGVEDAESDLPPLPTFPREGDTECLGNCKCYLEVETRGTGEEEPTYEAADRVVDPTVTIEDGEETSLVDYTEDELHGFQTEADALEAEMQWARAMYDATGDDEYLRRRKEANARSIELQDETGLRYVPRARSDTVSRAMQEGLDAGYEPVTPDDAGKLTAGMEASLTDGADLLRGTLTDWDRTQGAGSFTDEAGDTFAVTGLDQPPHVVGVRGLESWVDRPWKIPEVPPDGFVTQMPAQQASFAEERMCGETLDEATRAPCDPVPALRTYAELLDKMSPDQRAGIQVRVVPSERRRTEKAYGSYAPITVDDLQAHAEQPRLFAAALGRTVEARLKPERRAEYLAALAALPDGAMTPTSFADAYGAWLVDDPDLPYMLDEYFTQLEDDPDALNDPFYDEPDDE